MHVRLRVCIRVWRACMCSPCTHTCACVYMRVACVQERIRVRICVYMRGACVWGHTRACVLAYNYAYAEHHGVLERFKILEHQK